MFSMVFSRLRGGLLTLACNEDCYNITPFVKLLYPMCKILKQNIISYGYVQIGDKLDQHIFHSFGIPILVLIKAHFESNYSPYYNNLSLIRTPIVATRVTSGTY